MLCAGAVSRDVEIRKQRHIPKFAEFANQSPLLTMLEFIT